MVEDHPIKYKDFEGTIEKGQYGAGTVMIWDNGYWTPKNKIDFNKILKFTLHGKRLKGTWTLVPFKDNNYLLIKEKDKYIGYKNINEYKTSIKTGKIMKEIENNEENIEITNPNKVIFKKEKITKLDIVNYYKKVSTRMLPYLKNRIVSTVRCPSGTKGNCFFKKHLENTNNGIGKVKLKNDSGKKDDYYYIKNINGLISQAQMNSYEFHVWGSKVQNKEKPDIMVFDLDPDTNVDLDTLREGVKDLKKILDKLKLKSYLKTSGNKGYHIVVPGNYKSFKEVRQISKDIALLMEKTYPNKYTSNMRKVCRKNKIFIDWIRNTRGSTSVCPYSIRTKTASVSMPIRYSELYKIGPSDIKMSDAIKRLKRKEPWDDNYY